MNQGQAKEAVGCNNELKLIGKLDNRLTLRSGQLYFLKMSSYVSGAPSVMSIMARLHRVPRPV